MHHGQSRGKPETKKNKNMGVIYTGIDLSKILGGQSKNIGGKGGKKMINAWAFLNYWGHVHGPPPKVYAYGSLYALLK